LRLEFQAELARLEEDLQHESELVRTALRGSLSALRRQDLSLAEDVIAFDDAVDEAYVRVEQAIHLLLARQTPVAIDLRLVLAMIHVNLHLERMADLCVTVAKLAKVTHGLSPDPAIMEGFDDMATRAEEMVEVAMRAFRERNLEDAESLVGLDELIDRANRRVVRHVLALGGDPDMQEWGVQMIIVSRCLERFGDHAVDIGEQVSFLVTGVFREFTDASHPDGSGLP
jgi:phosphate transport system protein